MFENVAGLQPEVAARWTALVEECRPVLMRDGMEVVQALLVERGMSIVPAVAITKALLGWADTPLLAAREIVETSAARMPVHRTETPARNADTRGAVGCGHGFSCTRTRP
ncbi:hypothetical protein [Saccharothrix sp. ST-888]|uniref:hypothetical protein n=1 Tax=Saccharothrix sp. ST-888 TaxID=1427391 RepID=UPI0007C64F4D|nr:hypothetical protein [Saccharothrix sp. ST-888]